jgi:hypothetical protein
VWPGDKAGEFGVDTRAYSPGGTRAAPGAAVSNLRFDHRGRARATCSCRRARTSSGRCARPGPLACEQPREHGLASAQLIAVCWHGINLDAALLSAPRPESFAASFR